MIYYKTETLVTPLGLAVTALMIALVLFLPRRYAITPLILAVCYIPMATCIVLGGLTFPMVRIVLLFAYLRILCRGEYRSVVINPIDASLLAWIIASTITYTLLWQSGEALKNRLGLAYNAIGFYFIFRLLVRDLADAGRVVRILAAASIPLAGCLIVERITTTNIFSSLAGLELTPAARHGVLRCQGPFAHPILAGTFAATLIPLLFALWSADGKKGLATASFFATVAIVTCAASSGPLMAAIAGAVALGLWPWRRQVYRVRNAALAVFLAAAILMEAPVWYLMARLNIFSGSTGWYRAFLLDLATKHLNEWWLIGTRTITHWSDSYVLVNDITNQYLRVGFEGGLLTLALFLLVIVQCFRGVGRSVRESHPHTLRRQLYAWSFGSALFAHAVNFTSVSYFDQNALIWYILLAIISHMSGPLLLHRHFRPNSVRIRSEHAN